LVVVVSRQVAVHHAHRHAIDVEPGIVIKR
jgi:hypothetical protein